MIDSVSGRLVSKSSGRAVVECGGIGYLLRISLATHGKLPNPGDECRLLTRLLVREDALELVGFADEPERRVFGALLGVSGIGANLALGILSGLRPREIVEAVREGNHTALRRVKGLGGKKAERLVLELRGRIEELALGPAEAEPARPSHGTTAEDAIGALLVLGYRRPEAEPAVAAALRELGGEAELAELVRSALQHAR